MTRIEVGKVSKVGEQVAKKASKVATEVFETAEHKPMKLAHVGSDVLRAYANVKAPTEKLFISFEEYVENFLGRLTKYKQDIPEGLYNLIEKNAKENNFEFSKVMQKYYSGLNECKTMEEVRKRYPEFKGLKLEPEEFVRQNLQRMIPRDLSERLKNMPTKDDKINYVMNYFDRVISEQAKKWSAYPEILKYQRQMAEDIVSGVHNDTSCNSLKYGNVFYDNSGYKYHNCSKMPIQYEFLGVNNKDELLIDLLKQIYIEGKNIREAYITTEKGRKITASCLHNRGCKFIDAELSVAKKFLSGAEKDVNEYIQLSNLSREEINSAVLNHAWIKSGLKRDYASATEYGKGWSNIRHILYKEKYPKNTKYSSEKIVDAYLVEQYKKSRIPEGGNPFEKYENLNENVARRVNRFVNFRYHDAKIQSDSDVTVLTEGFKNFKSQYDVEGMTKSWEKIEQHYKNIFFKVFWFDSRIERFREALKESNEIASKNIELSEELLSRAMLEAVE